MKLVKIITTNSVYLRDLVEVCGHINSLDYARNREIIINGLLEVVIDNIKRTVFDIPNDITINDVSEVIHDTIPNIVIPLKLLETIVPILNIIREELTPIVILEAFEPSTTVYTSYLINEIIKIRLYDISPMQRISNDSR
jgi:hypothetical protein